MMKKGLFIFVGGIVLTALVAGLILALSLAKSKNGQKHENDLIRRETSDMTDMKGLESFTLGQVEQQDSYCVNGLEKELLYLTSFDTDKWLAGFRETAGLDTKGVLRYSGWESSLIGGHSFGHYLTACAQAYANAGVGEEERQELYSILTTLVDGLLECQENTKGKPGFIFAATLANKNNVEQQFDNVEWGRTNISTEAWVPWYTMHKIIAGLIDVYQLTGYENALTVAKGLGDWTYNRSSSWSNATRSKVLSIEYGGMNDCLYQLYILTGDEKYAVAAHLFDEDGLFKKVATGAENALADRHANTTIPKFLGALNRYVATNGKVIAGETVDATDYLAYAEAFWEMVVERHTYVTGGNSEWEHFGKDNILDAERTNANNETCNVYNMLKLSRLLFEITGEKKYADYYENAFYNTILSSQNPETGMTTYFQPMATGYFKVYGTKFTKFWCCTGTGMENFTKLNDSIYFHKDNTVFVNMYLSSRLTWDEKNLILTQESSIPESDTAVFTISAINGKKVDVDLRFRLPDWLAGDVKVQIDGQDYETKVIDGYVCVFGEFRNGAKITLSLPMTVTAYTLQDNESAVAFKYGPLVLSAHLGTEDMKTTTTGIIVTIPAQKLVESDTILLPAGVSRENFLKDISKYMTKGEGLTFRLTGCDYEFTPHYLQYKERYGIYWYIKTQAEQEAEDAGKKRSEDLILDTVQPGYGQYENDELHQMAETATVGVTNDGTYRYAEANGSFTYRMIVNPDGNNYLSLTLRKSDNGKTLCIKSGEQVLFSDKLDYIGLSDSYELRVKIPAELAKNATHVSANDKDCYVLPITFCSADSAESAKVCEFIYTLDVKPLYTSDEKVAYFVDCGDYDTTTVSKGDAFGVYNSLTEQLYGYDPVTGKKWGLIDDANDQYGGNGNNKGGLYTAHTWCYEFNNGDGLSKTSSNRYTKNQYESGIKDRYLDYGFELPNGTYTVEIGFSNPWNCSNLPDVYANKGTDNEQLLAKALNVTATPLTATVTVTDGKLTLNFRNSTSKGLAINVCYIKIMFN